VLLGALAIIGVVATVVLSVGAVLSAALTPAAGGVAAAFGIVIVLFVGFPFLALLVLFVAACTLATRYRFEEKKRQHVEEGRVGERGVPNVVAHIILPTGIAIAGGLSSPILHSAATSALFASALAFGTADTFASEFGVLSGHARSILTGRPVTPGTNGGVSSRGQLFALVAAVLTGAVGAGLFALFGEPLANPAVFVVTVTAAGFLGCQVDSVLGEVFENRGLLSKGSINFLGMLSAIAFSSAVLVVVGTGL
jgi:uncharacterized protein (TIGR00297 family)